LVTNAHFFYFRDRLTAFNRNIIDRTCAKFFEDRKKFEAQGIKKFERILKNDLKNLKI